MKTKNWFFIWGLLAMMLAFAACSDDNDGDDGDDDNGLSGKSELVGVWESLPGEDGGVIEFRENGTYVWDEYEVGEYVYENGILRLKYDGEVDLFYVELRGKTLTLTYVGYPGEGFTFHRLSGGDTGMDDGEDDYSILGTWINYEEREWLVFRRDGTCIAGGDEAGYTYNARTGKLVIDYGDGYPDVFRVVALDSAKIVLEDESGMNWTFWRE